MSMKRRFAQGSPTQRRGSAAEALAERHLAAQGFQVVARNHVCRGGEVDLVVEKGELLCFVEVRSTADERFGGPLVTVGPQKQHKIIRAARDYLWRAGGPERAVRFDVVAVVGGKVTWIPGAFEA